MIDQSLTPLQQRVMAALRELEIGGTSYKVARRARIGVPSCQKVLVRLEAKGLVKRSWRLWSLVEEGSR